MERKRKPDARYQPTKYDEIEFDTVSGIFYFRGTPVTGRKEVFRSLKVKSIGLAVIAKKALLNELRGADPHQKDFFFSEAAELLLGDYQHRLAVAPDRYKHKIQHTLDVVAHYLTKHLIPFFGSDRVEDIGKARWQEYSKYAQAESLARLKRVRSLDRDRRLLVQIINEARRLGKYRFEMPKFELPDNEAWGKIKSAPVVIFTADEIKVLWEKAKGTMRGLVVHGYKMGLRPIEVFGTEWHQVDFEKNTYEITLEQAKRNKRKSAARTIALNSTCREYLWELFEARESNSRRTRYKDSPWVYPARGYPERHVDCYNKQWRRLLAECKIPYRRPYTLRHTAITEACKRLKEGKTSIVDLAQYFGTSVSEIERTYLHFFHEDTKHVAEIMEIRGAI